MSMEGEDDEFGDFVDSSFTTEPAVSTVPQPSSEEPFPEQKLAVNDPFGDIHETVVEPQSNTLDDTDKVVTEDDDWDNFESAPAVSTPAAIEQVVEPAVEPKVEEPTPALVEPTPALDLELTFTSTPTPSSATVSNEALSDPLDGSTTEEARIPNNVSHVDSVVTEVEASPSKNDSELEAEKIVEPAPAALEPSLAEKPSTPIEHTILVATEDISINNDSFVKEESSDPFDFLTIEEPSPGPVVEPVTVLDSEDLFADLSASSEQPQVVSAEIEQEQFVGEDTIVDSTKISDKVGTIALATEEDSDPFDAITTSEDPVTTVSEETEPVNVTPTPPAVESNETEVVVLPAATESSAVEESSDPFDFLSAEEEAIPAPIIADPVEASSETIVTTEVEVEEAKSVTVDMQDSTVVDHTEASDTAEDPFHSSGTEEVQLVQVSADNDVPAQSDLFAKLDAEPSSLLGEDPVTLPKESLAAESSAVEEEVKYEDASHEELSAPVLELEVEVEVEAQTEAHVEILEAAQEGNTASVAVVDESEEIDKADPSDAFDHFDAVAAPETATQTVTEEVQQEQDEDSCDNFEVAAMSTAVVSSPVLGATEDSADSNLEVGSGDAAVVDEVHNAEQQLEEEEKMFIVDGFEAAFESAAPDEEIPVDHQDVKGQEGQIVEAEAVAAANSDVEKVKITEKEEEDDDWDTFASASPVPGDDQETENKTEEMITVDIVPLAAAEETEPSPIEELAENQDGVAENAFGDDDDEWDAFEAAPAVVEEAPAITSAVPEVKEEEVKEPASSEFGEDNDWDAFESAPAQSSDTAAAAAAAEIPASSTEAFGDNDASDDEWDAFEAAVPVEAPAIVEAAAGAAATTTTAAVEGGDEWDASHGPGEETTAPATVDSQSNVPSSSTSVTVALTGNQPIDQEIAALQTLLGVNANTDFLSKLASLKALTSSLYLVDKEAMASPVQNNDSSEVDIDWLDEALSTPETPSTLTSWKATCNEAHITIVRQILVENIPPNACSLDQLQNELDCESKKYVVKTAEMKHRRVSSSESMMQDALTSLKTSSSANNFSEESDSDWNVRATSSPPSPVPPARQEDRPNNNTNTNNNANNNNNNVNDLSKAAADFLRSLPNLAYILQ